VLKGPPLGKVFATIVTTTAGLALLSCSATQPTADHFSTNSTVFEPLAPITRAPLSAPVGYASPFPLRNSSDGSASFGTWQDSPRWAAINGDGCIVVEREADAQAATFKVTNCSKE
jgi:hypothetical protein